MDKTSPPNLPSPIIKNKISYLKKFFLGIFILLALIIFTALAYKLYKERGKHEEQGNENLTQLQNDSRYQPLRDFMGTIEKINGQSLTVASTQYHENSSQDITYKIQINDQTELRMDPVFIPYSLKPATPSAKTASLSDLTVGKSINVQAREDIRKSNTLTAKVITINPGLILLEGKITEVSGNQLKIYATPPSAPREMEYQLTFDNQTEIVAGTARSTTQLPPSALENGKFIRVYTDKDIESQDQLKALKIELTSLTQ